MGDLNTAHRRQKIYSWKVKRQDSPVTCTLRTRAAAATTTFPPLPLASPVEPSDGISHPDNTPLVP